MAEPSNNRYSGFFIFYHFQNLKTLNFWDFMDSIYFILSVIWMYFIIHAVHLTATDLSHAQYHFLFAKMFLGSSAIPLSISLLKYLTIFKSLGLLVINVIKMCKDVMLFGVVLVISNLGFGYEKELRFLLIKFIAAHIYTYYII